MVRTSMFDIINRFARNVDHYIIALTEMQKSRIDLVRR